MGTISILPQIVIALAPTAGYVLGRFTKEELKPGRKWFLAAKHALFAAIASAFVYAHKPQPLPMSIGIALLFGYLAFDKMRAWWLVQPALGAAYGLAADLQIGFVIGALVFAYGLPAGALSAGKKTYEPLLAGLLFFVAATIISVYRWP